MRSGRYERLKPLNKGLIDCMRENIIVTTSGLAWEPAIRLCIEVMGEDRVMYAMDYPYQYVADEVRTHDNLDLPPAILRKLMQTNAERVFGFTAA